MTIPPLASGVWGVLTTPFQGDHAQIDLDSFASQVQHYQAAGVTGLVVLGVLGEAGRLSPEEQRAVLDAMAATAGTTPVVAGLSGLATAPLIAQAEVARSVLGDILVGVMAQVNSPRPTEVHAHFDAIVSATGVGIVAQDYPGASGVVISQDTLYHLLAGYDGIVAVKAESPPTPVAISYLAARVNVPLFGGLGGVNLIDELAAGAAGAMTGFSYPEGLVAAVAAFHEAGFEAAREAFMPWLPIVNFEAQGDVGLAIRKEILRRRGIIRESLVRRPGVALPEELLPLLELHLARTP